RIEHTVTAVIEVDGKTKTLSRTLREKWQTEKGKTEEVYKGNETLYEIDSIPLKMSEYNARISGWVDEELFKLVTNPLAFVNLKTQRQREILMEMGGLGDDLSIAREYGKGNIIAIIESDKTVTDRAKELAKTKSKLKKELDIIPPRIDEVSRSIVPDVRDTGDIEDDIAEMKKKIKAVSDKIEAMKSGGATVEIEGEIKRLEIQREQARLACQAEAQRIKSENYELELARKQETENLYSEIRSAERSILELREDISFAKGQQNKLREEYKSVRADEFPEFSDTACPCCGRALDKDVLTTKRAELEERRKAHNAARAKRLAEINEKGTSYKATIEDSEKRAETLTKKIEGLKAKISELTEKPVNKKPIPIFDDEYQPKIDELKAQLESDVIDTSAEEEQLAALTSELTALENEKLTATNNRKAKNRIFELEGEARDKAQAIADIEREEAIIEDFTKTKIAALDKAVNNRFKKVKFKLYDYQINGGFTECCEPTIDGVPYSDLNGSGKVNAGLDIINALQGFYGIEVPLFIDNKEAVNSPLKLGCQTIYLKVVGEEQAADVKVIDISKGVA
ncbi:MAG: hypothetical protein IJL89_10085, partial [Firmicutes bacterium]|nr:hypothetical protein [Bacillota bacterium]